MAKNQNKRLGPVLLQADLDALTALRSINGYTPANASYTLDAASESQGSMLEAQDSELAAQNALGTARDIAAAAEWDFHNFILSIKEQVIAQFGKDSNEVQSLGLKKKSEYKTPGGRKKAGA